MIKKKLKIKVITEDDLMDVMLHTPGYNLSTSRNLKIRYCEGYANDNNVILRVLEKDGKTLVHDFHPGAPTLAGQTLGFIRLPKPPAKLSFQFGGAKKPD